MSIILLVLGLLLFLGLVVLHELGHFLAARRNGVEVEEFGIGFPPKAWSRRIKSVKGDYELSVNWLPLGGFVKLKGEHDADRTPGSFGRAGLWPKVKIMLAGIVMNLAAAFVLLIITALVGLPQLLPNQFTVASDTKIVRQELLVGYVEPGSPAEAAGLRIQDQLLSMGPSGQTQAITDVDAFPELTRQYADQEVTLEYQRDGERFSRPVTLRSIQEVEASKTTDQPKGYLGVVPTGLVVRRSTWSAPVVAAGLIGQLTQETFKGLGNMVTSLFKGDTTAATQQVSGPVGIFVILRDGSSLGYQFVLLIVAVISLTLALMNVLPIPALDGGRLFVTLLFRIIRKPLTKQVEERIHGTGFALLMLTFVLITIVDVKRFF